MGHITFGFFPEESIELFKKHRKEWLKTHEGVRAAYREAMDLTARFFYQESVPEHIAAWIEVLEETKSDLFGSSWHDRAAVDRIAHFRTTLFVLIEQLKGLQVMRVSYSADRLCSCPVHGPLICFISQVRETNLEALGSHLGKDYSIPVMKCEVNNLMDAGLVKRSIDGTISLTLYGREQFKHL